MNAFRVIAAILIIGLLTKPLGFIPASILAAIVMVLTGFFQTKSVIDGVEVAADSEKAAIPSAREEKPLSFTPRDMSVRDSSESIKGRAPISDSVIVALTFLTAIRQAELGQNEAGGEHALSAEPGTDDVAHISPPSCLRFRRVHKPA